MKLLSSFLVLLFSLNVLATESNSSRFSSFNQDSKERQDFVYNEIKQVNQRLKNSPNKKILEAAFRKQYDVDRTIAASKNFKLIDHGLGKSQELIQTINDQKEVIFSTFQIARNNNYSAMTFKLNPTNNVVAIVFEFLGSIDDYYFIIVDIASKKILTEKPIYFNGSAPSALFWKDDQNLYVEDLSKTDKSGIKKYNLESLKNPEMAFLNYSFAGEADGWIQLIEEKTSLFIKGDQTKKIMNVEEMIFLGERDGALFFHNNKSDIQQNKTEILKYSEETLSVFYEVPFYTESANLLESVITLEENLGTKKKLITLGLKSHEIFTTSIPDFVSLTSNDEQDSETLVLFINSDLGTKKEIFWSFKSGPINWEKNLKPSMLENDQHKLEVEFIDVKSFDGTLIPIRMVYLKGTELKNRPVYLEAYGGFGLDAYLAPTFGFFNFEFIKQGGVYIGTGLRGGNEYGPTWHNSAKLENKYKTYEDLASIAKWLIESGISQREQIVIGGSSNGGLTVAATALLYPEYFGLVIPHNGVLDLLGKEELDAKFSDGWSYEYGDSRKPEDKEYLTKISPLELVQNLQNGPRFLVINGRKDTRVNPAHSIKFLKAAREIPNSQIELISLNNSGHFNLSPKYDDYIAWRAEVVKWSTIYDHLGIRLPPR